MGTVGLSLGITPTLSAASKIILILMMYAGRVGILTLGLAIGEKKSNAEIRKPIGNLLIG
jgi:trk system potassium uptake protein TrkH